MSVEYAVAVGGEPPVEVTVEAADGPADDDPTDDGTETGNEAGSDADGGDGGGFPVLPAIVATAAVAGGALLARRRILEDR